MHILFFVIHSGECNDIAPGEDVMKVSSIQFNSIQFNSIQTVYFSEGAYNSNMALDQRGRTMPKPFLSNNDILSNFKLRIPMGLFMSTLVISITNAGYSYNKNRKHMTHKIT